MKRVIVLSGFSALTLSLGFAQSIWFLEDFYEPRVTSSWVHTSPQWTLTGTSLRCSTGSYDDLFACRFYALGTTPYSIEIVMRGARAGVYFHLDSTASKAFSHMVRFDEKSVLTGYFNGAGEYRATNTFASPVMPSDWLTLRIDIDPVGSRYSVHVNGTHIGTDSVMMYRSGYVGLQASDGIAEFKSFRVHAAVREQAPLTNFVPGDVIRFQHVRYVRKDSAGVTIYNPELGRYQTLDADGRLMSERTGIAPVLRQRVILGDRTYSIEGANIMIRNAAGLLVDSLVGRTLLPASLTAGSIGDKPVLYVADPGVNAVLVFNDRGEFEKSFTAASIGGFRGPLSLDVLGSDTLVIADFDRLIFVGQTLEDVHPTLRFLSPSEAEITWPRTIEMEPHIDFSGKAALTASVSNEGRSNVVRLHGLLPLKRYNYHLSPVLKTIPAAASFSRLYTLSTPPDDPTMMSYVRLPLMVMAYRTISYRDAYSRDRFPDVPDGRTLTGAEIEYLKKAAALNADFYFRNSSCRLVLDFDFIVIEDTLWLREVGEKDPYWLSANERVTRDFERSAKQFGRKPEQYVGLISPYAWVNYPPRRRGAMRDVPQKDSIRIRQAYGGGTFGVPAPWRYGATAGYTANPFQDMYSRQDWLITHEFHHQVDALMEASGYPEYYHSDMPWKMDGRFGEDFDFNAHIIRLAPPEAWLGLAYGTLQQARDADRDGVPDDDPSLPFDEKRLNGNPGMTDTDGDGLSDLQEVMAGTFRGTLLDNEDTDGDDLADGVDPEPLYSFNGMIKQGVVSTYIGSVQQPDLLADVYLGWDDRYFYVRYEADRPANLLLQIDANADGWFHGFDNIQARIFTNEDSLSVADFYLRDCSSWTKAPSDRRDIVNRTDLIVDVEKQGVQITGRGVRIRGRGVLPQARVRVDTYILTVKVPALPSHGMNLERGKKLGIRLGLQTVPDLWVWHELFERNYMMKVELQ